MKLLVARLGLLALSFPFQAAAQEEPSRGAVARSSGQVGRSCATRARITRTHHYYFVSPWSPDASQVVFFQFDRSVEKLTATGRYQGVLVVMNSGRHGHGASWRAP